MYIAKLEKSRRMINKTGLHLLREDTTVLSYTGNVGYAVNFQFLQFVVDAWLFYCSFKQCMKFIHNVWCIFHIKLCLKKEV